MFFVTQNRKLLNFLAEKSLELSQIEKWLKLNVIELHWMENNDNFINDKN